MYKLILLPTDGSALSKKAVAAGIRFARDSGAQVVGLHVVPVPHDDELEAWTHHDPHFAERRRALFDRFGDEYLAFVLDNAKAEQVGCTVIKERSGDAATAIVKTADEMGCDLIYMASHGWKAGQAVALGSETFKVLHTSKAPVLVFKPT
jgi:nucleotide-binding universal stress UspA family protein